MKIVKRSVVVPTIPIMIIAVICIAVRFITIFSDTIIPHEYIQVIKIISFIVITIIVIMGSCDSIMRIFCIAVVIHNLPPTILVN